MKRFHPPQVQAINWKYLVVDLLWIPLSVLGSFAARVGTDVLLMDYVPQALSTLAIALFVKPFIFYWGGLYTPQPIYSTKKELSKIVISVTTASVILAMTVTVMTFLQANLPESRGYPRSTLIIDWAFSLFLAGGLRFYPKLMIENRLFWASDFYENPVRRTLIIGAGDTGSKVVQEIQKNRDLNLEPVAFLDNTPGKNGQQVCGIPVWESLNDLERMIDIFGIQEVVIALPKPSHNLMTKAANICRQKNVIFRNVQNIRTSQRFYTTSLLIIGLIGFCLRTYSYGLNRSLWIDEANLALNIVNRSLVALFEPLDFNQGAPVGFLLLQKTVVSLFGNKDYILRLIPWSAGLISIPLMYALSKRFLGRWSILTSLGLFALSQKLIAYSSEVKQYSTDVLATLLLLYFGSKCLEDQVKPPTLIRFGIAGLVAIWISHPSLFVFLGIFLTLGLNFFINRDSDRILWLLGIGSIWAINLSILYLVSLRALESNDYLINYWKGAFAPFPPWSDIGWLPRKLGDILRDPATLPVNAISVVLLTLGVFSFIHRRWQFSLFLIAPFFLTVSASTIERYPFAGRLTLFLVPLLLLFLTEGIEMVRIALLKANKTIGALVYIFLIVYFLYGPIVSAIDNLRSPAMHEHIKPLMAYLEDNFQSHDLIYVYYGAGPAFEFYASQFEFSPDAYIIGSSAREDPDQYLRDLDNLREHQHLWVVFSHICPKCAIDEEDFILEYLDEIGMKRRIFVLSDASLYLYHLNPMP